MTSENKEIVLKGRLNGSQRNRLAKLLDMWYRPSELAGEVGFNVRQVYRVYIKLGLPHDRDDDTNHIFINGITFREWYLDVYKKSVVGPNETFCKTCRKPVEIVSPRKKERYHLIGLLSTCPNCGRTCWRIVQNKKRENDKSE